MKLNIYPCIKELKAEADSQEMSESDVELDDAIAERNENLEENEGGELVDQGVDTEIEGRKDEEKEEIAKE